MKVLMITGDKRFGPGHPRYDLQKSAVEALDVLYWGRGALWPALPQGSFDVVSAQDPLWRGLFGLYAARRLRATLNVQVHMDLDVLSGGRQALARFILRRAHSVRVVSEKIKEQVGTLGVKAPITVLPVFVELEKFRSIVREPHEGKNVLWIGRFEPEKDPLMAVEVLKQVRAQGIDARLIFLGSGALEPQLRHAAEGLPVSFPGWQSPLPHLAVADVVVSTSRHESWGESIVEALAAGVPVVAPDVGVAAEAGAAVVPRAALSDAVAQTLILGTRGTLRLELLEAQAWAKRFRESFT